MSTDLPEHTTDTKRDELRSKIEAGERRLAERTLADDAREAAEAAADFTKKNPLVVLGGAVALGLVIGLMTKPGRRAAVNAATGAANVASGAASGAANAASNAATGAAKGVGNAAKKRGSAFLSLVTDALIAYGMKLIDEALDGARNGQNRLEDVGDVATAKARSLRREASYVAGSAADKGRTIARRTRRRAERAVRDLTDSTPN